MGTGFKDQEHDHNFEDKEVWSRKAVCKLSTENKDRVLICKFYVVGL